MASLPTRNLKPEEEELKRKKAELAQLETELAERELDLATRRGELAAFEKTYLEGVGRRYAELDRLEAQIAEAGARQDPADETARMQVEAARRRARESTKAVAGLDQAASPVEFKPSDNLKQLYREVAKLLHPDLTTDEAEKERRQKLMTEVNRAYAEGNEARIRAILRDWESSPESVKGEGTAVELVRTIRKIAQVQARLRIIKLEIDELQRGELVQLKSKVEQAARLGRDLLAELAHQLDRDIADAQGRLEQISGKAGDERGT